MPSASSLFLLFLHFRKVTTGNITGLPSKFTEIFYATEDTRGPKGRLGGHPQGRGDPGPRPHLDPWVGPASAPGASPRPPPTPIKPSQTKNPNTRRIFPNTIQSSATIVDKFRGSDCLFRQPAGTGIGPRSHLHRHRCLQDEL